MASPDPVSKLPAVVRSQQAHAAAMRRPMLGVRMVGDPRFDDAENDLIADLLTRRAVQYATAMLRRDGRLGDNLREVDAEFAPPATVLFFRADKSRTKLAEFTVPERVMSFDPTGGAP
jgi:hypothetical protein